MDELQRMYNKITSKLERLIYNFSVSKNRKPAIVIITEESKGVLRDFYKYRYMIEGRENETMSFMGIEIISSRDLKEDEIKIY